MPWMTTVVSLLMRIDMRRDRAARARNTRLRRGSRQPALPAHDAASCYRTGMSRETVLVERDGGVAVVTWNRPKQRNAFNQRMWLDGRDTLRELLDDRGVRAVVVTGAGEAFSA